MLANERRQIILEELQNHKTVVIVDLAERLEVTPMTIRRDLILLEKQGVVEKTYGGAVLSESSIREISYLKRKEVRTPEKHRIARAALELVDEGMCVCLDAGTTSYELALLLIEKQFSELTVVTNDLLIAYNIGQNSNYQVILLGGVIENSNGLTCGYFAKEMMKNLHVDICFVGTQAITDALEVMTANIDKVELKQCYLENSSEKILLADESKFVKNKLHKICSLTVFDQVITDKEFSDQEISYLTVNQVKVTKV